MKTLAAFCIIVFLVLLSGCVTKTWVSTPAMQTAGNEYFDARFEPIKHNEKFFDAFRLVVTNKTSKDLVINWKRTEYLYNDRKSGLFTFKGLIPESIHNPPPDVVAAGQTFSKEIWPIKLMTWAPIRERIEAEERGFGRGIIPEGKNGISLVILVDGKEITKTIAIAIKVKKRD
jgi:hypothetical protein